MLDEDTLYQLIGDRIKSIRKSKEISQEELGKKIDLLRTSVTNIESGKQRPSIFLLYRICNSLNVEIFAILPSLHEISSNNFQLSNQHFYSIIEDMKMNIVGIENIDNKRKTLVLLNNLLTK